MPVGGGSWGRTGAGAAFALVILALTFLWRMPATPGEWNFLTCDNDSLFHLHQVQRSLPTYPQVLSPDRYSHFPHGFRVHWLAPHTFFYATTARLFDLDGQPFSAMVSGLSLVPPLLSLVGLTLTVLLARAYSDRWLVAALTALLAAVCGETVRPFFYGTIDHHLFAHLGVLTSVLGRLRRNLALWMIGLLLLCAMTPEALLYVSVLTIALAAAEALALLTGGDDGGTSAAWFVAPAIAGGLAWGADRILQAQPLPLSSFTWALPTLFQPAWYAVLGCSAGGALAYVRSRQVAERAASMAVAGLGVMAAAAIFLTASGSLGEIAARLAGAGRLYVGEETSVFRRGFFSAHPWYQLLALSSLYAIWRLGRAWRERQSSVTLFAWTMLLAAYGLGFTEMRHLYIFAPLQLIGFSLAAVAVGECVAGLVGTVAPTAVAGVVAIGLSLPLLLSADVTNRSANRAAACASMAEEVTGWLEQESPSPGNEDVEAPSYAVFAPWTMGHQIHVLAHRAVVTDPFNHVDPETGDWVGQVAEKEWLAESESELVSSLRRLGVRYLVLPNPAEEIVAALRRSGTNVDDLYRIEPDGRVTLLPALNRYAAFRIFMAGGAVPIGGLALRHRSEAAETYGTTHEAGEAGSVSVPSVQIYELTDSDGTTSSANN